MHYVKSEFEGLETRIPYVEREGGRRHFRRGSLVVDAKSGRSGMFSHLLDPFADEWMVIKDEDGDAFNASESNVEEIIDDKIIADLQNDIRDIDLEIGKIDVSLKKAPFRINNASDVFDRRQELIARRKRYVFMMRRFQEQDLVGFDRITDEMSATGKHIRLRIDDCDGSFHVLVETNRMGYLRCKRCALVIGGFLQIGGGSKDMNSDPHDESDTIWFDRETL